MDDRDLTEVLAVVDRTGASPDPVFLDRLYGELATDLRFLEPAEDRATSMTPGGQPMRSTRRWLVAAAAILVALLGSALLAGAAMRLIDEQRRTTLLDLIRIEGELRVAVRDGYPQARSPEGALGGIDIDVANELARRLGVTARTVPHAATMADGDWQISLDPAASMLESWSGSFASRPIYFWPVHVVVPADSPLESVAGLSGSGICVVSGSSGEAWLAGRAGGPGIRQGVDPPSVEVVMRPDDEACLDALAGGTVAASVTADIDPAGLAVRGSIRVLGGPVLTEERRAVIARDAAGAEALLGAIDAAIEAARADGTLSDLARSRFGGHDLSVLPTGYLED